MRFSFYYFLIVLVSIFNCASIERKTLEGRGLIDQTEIRGFKQFKIYTSRNYLGYIQAEKNPDSFDKKLWRGKVKEDSVKQTIILSYSTNRIAEVNPQLNEFLGAGGSYENVRELKLTLINPVIYVLEDISIEPAFSDKKEFFNNPYIGSVLKVDKIKIEFVDKNGFTLSASAALGIDSLNISSKIKKEDKEDYFYFAENAFVGYKLFPAPKDPEKYVTPEENKFRVVIFPFEVNSPDSKDEKYKHGLSEATSYAMNRISNYLVIARNEYQKVLEEQKLAGNENYDQKSAVSIGKIMSANTLVLGKLDRDGKKARIRCTLVDVQTGTVLEKGTLKQDVDVENKTLAQIADEWEDFVYSYLGQPTVRPKKSDSIIGTNSDKAWEYFVQGREKFLLMDEESLEKGVELFKKSIEEDPKFEEPHSYLAEAYIRLEYINQLYLGTKESFEDSKQKSFTHATRAIELQPDSHLAHLSMSLHYDYMDKDVEKSIFHAQTALEIRPSEPEAKLRLFKAEHSKNWTDIKPDNPELLAIYNLNPNLYISNMILGEVSRNNNNYKDAYKYFKKASKISPKNLNPVFNIVLTFLMANRLDKAKVWLEKANKMKPNSFPIYLYYGQYHLVAKDYKESLKALNKAIKKSPKSPKPFELMSIVFTRMGKKKETILSIKKCSKLEPKNPYYLKTLGDLYYEEEDLDKSLDSYIKALKLDPEDLSLVGSIGDVYLKKKDYENARKQYNEILQRGNSEEKFYAYHGLGEIFRREKKYIDSIANFQMALKIKPEDEETLIELSLSFYKSENIDESIKTIKRVLDKNPNHPRANYEYSKYLYKSGDKKKFKEYLDKSCKLGYESACKTAGKKMPE